jgi:hypothetical protein
METQLTTRALNITPSNDQLGGGFTGSFVLHAAVAALLLSWAWLFHSGQNWGDVSATSGAIQATMVNDIPLPPKQPMDPNNVLATDAPSPAPITAAQHTVDVPRPDAIGLLTKSTKPVKTADQATPTPPLHPQPTKADPNKVQTGEATGSNLTMSSTQTRAGTFSAIPSDAAFGTRFAWYVQQITQNLPGGARRLAHPHCAGPAQRRPHARPDRSQCRPPHRHLRPVARRLYHQQPHQRHLLLRSPAASLDRRTVVILP